MIKNLLKDKIDKSIKASPSFYDMLTDNYEINEIKDVILRDMELFLLSKEEIYKFDNFKDLFYGVILDFDDHRTANFFRNIINNHPDKIRTYNHILNDIENQLKENYDLPKKYIKMKRYELDKLCDDLLLKEEYHTISLIRNFIKDNFKVHDYGSFINENRDLAKKILRKNGLDETDKPYIRLFKLLEKNPGYLGLFTYFNKNEKIAFITLKRLYDRLVKMSDILFMLPQPVVNYMTPKLPYTTEDGRRYTKHFERLTDDLTVIEEKHSAKLFADKYPANLRRNIINNPVFVEIIKNLMRDDNYEDKLDMYNKFFIKKVSKYKTQEELIKALNVFFDALDESDDDIRDIVKNEYYLHNIFDNGELLVIRARDYESFQKIAHDTSWCIKDTLSYWVEYVNDGTIQLVIIDYTEPKSSLYRKIGVTLNKDDFGFSSKFRTAHLKNDGYVGEDEINKRLKKHEISLDDLHEMSKGYGNNVYYDDSEISDSEYRW